MVEKQWQRQLRSDRRPLDERFSHANDWEIAHQLMQEESMTDEFYEACALGRTADCESRLLKGMPVDCRNRCGLTALMVAAASGQLEVVKMLLNHRADPMLGDNWGYTALMKAAAYGHLDIFKLLWDQVRSMSCENTFLGRVTAVTEAAVNGHSDVTGWCIAQDPQLVDIPVEVTGMTPLMLAVVRGHRSTVDILLKHNADLDKKNCAGLTAVDMALQLNDENLIETLKVHSGRAGRNRLEVHENAKNGRKGCVLTPTSRFPIRIEHVGITSARRSKSKERPKAKRSIYTTKSGEIFRFILQSEGLEKLWDVFTDHEIDLKTFFTLTRDDFKSIGITDEQAINLMTVSHHYKPLFST